MKKLACLLLFVLPACHDVTGLAEMTPITDTAFLREVWEATEACSGLHRDMGHVKFFSTPTLSADGQEIAGIWLSGLDWVVVIDKLKDNRRLLMHEDMHALLGGGSDHPARYFNGVCGDIR